MLNPGTNPELNDRAFIAERIPHAERMCLLDALLEWDTESVRCAADSHRAADHPLRRGGRLGAACALEYAGQAIALHAALVAPAGGRSRGGLIVAVRDLTLDVERLDDLPERLVITGHRLDGDARAVLYAFDVRSGRTAVASGRLTVLPSLPPGLAS